LSLVFAAAFTFLPPQLHNVVKHPHRESHAYDRYRERNHVSHSPHLSTSLEFDWQLNRFTVVLGPGSTT